MAIDGHRRVIEAYARQLRTREWQAQHRQATRCVRRHVDEGKRLGLGGADITTLRAVLEDYAELLGTRAGAKEPSDA